MYPDHISWFNYTPYYLCADSYVPLNVWLWMHFNKTQCADHKPSTPFCINLHFYPAFLSGILIWFLVTETWIWGTGLLILSWCWISQNTPKVTFFFTPYNAIFRQNISLIIIFLYFIRMQYTIRTIINIQQKQDVFVKHKCPR